MWSGIRDCNDRSRASMGSGKVIVRILYPWYGDILSGSVYSRWTGYNRD